MALNIDKELIEKILCNHYGEESLKIIDFSCKDAIGKGQNYCSLVSRVYLKWETKNKKKEEKLIIKQLPEGEWIKDFVVNVDYFQREESYYQKFIPLFEKIFKNRTGEDLPKFSPTNYKCNRNNLLILEDLSPLGFESAPRQTGGGIHHATLVFQSLARLHALSIAASREDANFTKDRFLDGNVYIKENMHKLVKFFEGGMKNVVTGMESWPQFKKFIGRIKCQPIDYFIDYANCGKLRVMCQGDCWLSNMLFRFDKDTNIPIEVNLLDFQLIRWGPLAFDLVYFIFTSLTPETIEKHYDELYDLYITELHKWFKILGEEIGQYTKENILEDIKAMEPYAIGLSCTMMTMMMADAEDAPVMDNMDDLTNNEDGEMKKILEDEKYQTRILKIFEFCDKKGLID